MALEALSPGLAGLPAIETMCPEVHVDLRRPDEAAVLGGRYGLLLDVLARIGADSVGYADKGGVSLPVDEAERDFLVRLHTVARDFSRRAYLPAFFQAGGFVTLDPFTGRRLVSHHALPIDDNHIAYGFAGAETFYVGVGGLGGAVRFVSIPRLNCVVTMPNFGENDGHVEWSQKVHRNLLRSLLQHGVRAARPHAGKRQGTGVAIGFTGNLGHTLWQDLAGLADIIALHGADAVRHVLAGPHLPVPVRDLFPELAECPVTQVDAPGGRMLASLDLPYQHVRPIGLMIRPDLRRRVNALADRAGTPAMLERIRAAVEGRFVVWVTLRANLKVWTRQVDGHIAALRRLAADVGPMTVILDGWSNTAADAEAIRQALEPQGIRVVEILGCGFLEGLVWARQAHLYSAVVGSGLFVNSYFADRPGVAHGNNVHLQQARYWAELAPGSRRPVFIDAAAVADGGGLFDDYDFDPELLYAALRRLAGKVYPERLAQPGKWKQVASFHGMRLDPALPVSGLSHAEPDGTWTLGAAVRIGLPGPAPAGASLALTLAVYPNILPGICDAQRVTILVNGGQVWDGAVLRQSDIRALVPAALVAGAATITVSLVLPDAMAPAADGVSGDIRPLGLMLQSLVLEAQAG